MADITPDSRSRPSPAELQPPTFEHLTEAPSIASLLTKTVANSLHSRTRFPHTLLVGPPDSGKQIMAATIASEMGVSLTTIHAPSVTNIRDMHRTLRSVPAGSVVLFSQIDRADWVSAQLCRIAAGLPVCDQQVWRGAETPGDDWSSKIDSHPYHDFTIIATSRAPRADHRVMNEWAEVTIRTERTERSESIRLERVFHRLGVKVAPAALARLASFGTKSQIRTLMLARNVVALTEARHGSSIDLAAVEPALHDITEIMLTRAERERLRSGDSLSRSESTANRGLLGALAGSLDRSIDIDPEVKRKKRNKTIREVVLVSLGVIVVFSTSVFLAKWIEHRFIELRRTNAEASGQSLTATDPGTTSPPVEGSVSEGASAAPTSDASAASPTPP